MVERERSQKSPALDRLLARITFFVSAPVGADVLFDN
jgi:hypothetical protein